MNERQQFFTDAKMFELERLPTNTITYIFVRT